MSIGWEAITAVLFKLATLWVLLELARAVRANSKSNSSRDTERVLKSLDKVKSLLLDIETRVSAVSAREHGQKKLNKDEDSAAYN